MTGQTTISIYPVGVLAAWKRRRHRPLRLEAALLLRWAREGEWRAIRQSLNGYLAEINYPPAELAHLKCGHGWTKRRAAARLGRYLARDNPDR
jgi:hypothetical protein